MMEPDPTAPEGTGIAQYLGTEVGGKWWRKDRSPGLFVKGRGRYWFEGRELRFHRDLTKNLTRIPLERVTDVAFGSWHGGTWLAGRPVVKVVWTASDGSRRSSGFGFADRPSAEAFAVGVRRRLDASSG